MPTNKIENQANPYSDSSTINLPGIAIGKSFIYWSGSLLYAVGIPIGLDSPLNSKQEIQKVIAIFVSPFFKKFFRLPKSAFC